ncbi:hypothetical protein J6590_042211 [Homalodisca vitripennis]|nr:hypothetical protein J6590_042211 [Homalodisca vitripennis]
MLRYYSTTNAPPLNLHQATILFYHHCPTIEPPSMLHYYSTTNAPPLSLPQCSTTIPLLILQNFIPLISIAETPQLIHHQRSSPNSPPLSQVGKAGSRIRTGWLNRTADDNEQRPLSPSRYNASVQSRMPVSSTNRKNEDHNHTTHQHRLQWIRTVSYSVLDISRCKHTV